MKRRLNYTERKRITLEMIELNLTRLQGKVTSFTASLKLDELHLPGAAKIYIEAYHRTEFLRFSLGSIENMTPVQDLNIYELGNQESLLFRILVIDETGDHGLILASAEGIKPTGQYERHSILPVELRDLARQVWKLDFNGDIPVLVLNNKLPGALNLPSADSHFRLYVLPAVLREIFDYMFFIDKIDDLEEPAVDWHRMWLDFAKRLSPISDWPQVGEPIDNELVNKWIGQLEQDFCSILRKDWNKLVEEAA